MPRVRSGSSIRFASLNPVTWAGCLRRRSRPSAISQTRLADGGTEDLAGVSLLRFRADGLVVEERDFWAQR